MAENDIPVKEREDGSALVKLEDHPEDLLVEEEGEEPETEGKKKKKEKKDNDEPSAEDEDHDEEGDVALTGDETDEEREAIREARREERRLKKDLKRQREISAKNKIQALERRNEELAKRLAAVESTASSYQLAQLDKAVEDEATRVQYAKMRMVQAAQDNDVAAQMEYLEQLTDAKQRLAQVQAYKKQQLETAKSPKQNVPNPVNTEVQQNATKWLKKNSWYDPQARDTDSRIAKVIDQELAGEGWDAADPEYWEELDNRLQARLPHRYSSKGNSSNKKAGPTSSNRSSNSQVVKPGTVMLSRDRVQAIKDAGAWDDVAKRNKMIRAYQAYDRQNKG
jgi:hypothetical protein